MKYIIAESQYKMLMEQDEPKVLHIPNIDIFGDWESLQKYLERKGNPPYSLGGDLNLDNTNITDLGNLISVEGSVTLMKGPIKSLGSLTSVGRSLFLNGAPIESLGNLTYVGNYLFLEYSSVESLGNLTYVGKDINIINTPLSKNYSEEEIRKMVDVQGEIYL
jgi:hypothetical protein